MTDLYTSQLGLRDFFAGSPPAEGGDSSRRSLPGRPGPSLEELIEERDRMRALLTSLPVEVWFSDTAGNLSLANPLGAESLGLGGPDRAFQPIPEWTSLEILLPDGSPRPLDRTPLLRALLGENIANEEEIVRHPLSGELRHRLVSAAPVRSADGQITGSVAAVRDITDLKAAQAAAQDTIRRFAVLAGTAEKLLAAPEPQRVVNELCQSVMEYLDCHVFFNFLVDPAAQALRLNACAGIPQAEAEAIATLDYGQAVCGCAARDACRIVAQHIMTTPDPRTELVKSYGVRAYAAHPLFGENGQVLGTLSFGTRTRDTFSEADLSLMKAVADQVAIAMVRLRDREALQRAHDDLERRVIERTASLQAATDELDRTNRSLQVTMYELEASRQQLQALSRRVVDVQERERRFVADQLYNQAGQVLAAAKMQMAVLRQALSGQPDAMQSLSGTQEMLDGVLRDLHDLASGLRPASLDKLGLAAALNQYVAEFGQRHEINARLQVSSMNGVRLTSDVETVLYRIVQEALANVAQHGETSAVDLILERRDGQLFLAIEDHGCGFDLQAVSVRGAVGLVGMRERAESIGARLSIETAPGKGTKLRVSVPLPAPLPSRTPSF